MGRNHGLGNFNSPASGSTAPGLGRLDRPVDDQFDAAENDQRQQEANRTREKKVFLKQDRPAPTLCSRTVIE
jgi:hypothetical protein